MSFESSQVCDALEELMEEGGCLVDHHGCDFFPERWFDLVIGGSLSPSGFSPLVGNRGML